MAAVDLVNHAREVAHGLTIDHVGGAAEAIRGGGCFGASPLALVGMADHAEFCVVTRTAVEA
jgi:hypothetical protein